MAVILEVLIDKLFCVQRLNLHGPILSHENMKIKTGILTQEINWKPNCYKGQYLDYNIIKYMSYIALKSA